VIASNNSGVWNEEGATLEFSIAPAYWQTNWFRALCVAALIALLWTLYLLRVRQLARHFKLTLEARVNERTRIARDLHDTLLQSFHGLLLRFQTARDMFASRPTDALQVLDGAIDQAIDAVTEGREAVQGLRSSTEEANDLADAIRTFGDALSAEEGNGPGVALRIDVKGGPRDLHPIVRDELVRIAGEAMRNAFRHAAGKHLEVEIHYDDRRMRVRVRDDGKGIAAETLQAGAREGHFGLPGMRERARLIGAKLTVWSRADEGTEVEVSIPAGHAYASPLPRTGWRDRFGSILRRGARPPRPMDP
jgi:signal transduction histidine kinase